MNSLQIFYETFIQILSKVVFLFNFSEYLLYRKPSDFKYFWFKYKGVM